MIHSCRTAWVAPIIVIVTSFGVNTSSLAGGPVLSAELPEATVTIGLPAAQIDVGSNAAFKVSVAPGNGKPAPVRVRARLGMPMMGHWVTGEQTQKFAPELAFDFQDHLEMDSSIPMYGLYRLRVWLDYADGHDAKTAVDFRVMTDEPLRAEVVE